MDGKIVQFLMETCYAQMLNVAESELFGQTLRVCVAKANRAELGSEKPGSRFSITDVDNESLTHYLLF